MVAYISMLRGINVGAQKSIRMLELTKLYEGLQLTSVRTYVQSGNVLFDSTELDALKLAAAIEAQIEQIFAFKVSVFIRRPADFQRLIAANPFLGERREDPTKLHITFLYHPAAEAELSRLVRPNSETDEFMAGAQEIYLFCPNGYGRTKLSNTFFEKKLHLPATTRNWNTVLTLYKMAGEG
ncbi:MAG: DUF1697 domain-containing protein [Anaerolineaceae bacterium]|nr:DUF1697 domain-containing protein [Anaerolineaceae bacterium]